MSITLSQIHTNNDDLTVWDPSADDLAIGQLGLLHRIRGAPLHPDGTHVYNYDTYASHEVSGSILSAPDAAFNDRHVLTFGAGAYIDLTPNFPVAADVTEIVVFKRGATAGSQCILGSAGASYHTLHMTAVGDISNTTRASGGSNIALDDVDPALPHLLIRCWNHGLTRNRIYIDGSLAGSATGGASPNDPTIRIGGLGAVAIPFTGGKIGEVAIAPFDLSNDADALALIQDFYLDYFGIPAA